MLMKHKILISLDALLVLAIAAGYRAQGIDRLSLLAIGSLVLVVFNGVYFAVRTEPDLPKTRVRSLNRRVVWPISLLAILVLVFERFCTHS
jgi:hypothetical protein